MKNLSLLALALLFCGTQCMVADPETKTLELASFSGPIGKVEVPCGVMQIAELRQLVAPVVGPSFFKLLSGTQTLKNGEEVDTRDLGELSVVKYFNYSITHTGDKIILDVGGKVAVNFSVTKVEPPRGTHQEIVKGIKERLRGELPPAPRSAQYAEMVENKFAYLANPDLPVPNPLEGDFDSLHVSNISLIFAKHEVSMLIFRLGFSLDLLLYILEGHDYFCEHHKELLAEDNPKPIKELVFHTLTHTASLKTRELRAVLCENASKRYDFDIDLNKIPK